MMIKSAQISDKGPRAINQDAIFSYQDDDLALYVVADGMGGHLFGEVASGMIADAAAEWTQSEQYKALIKSGDIQEVMDDLEEVLMQANRRLYEEHNQGSNISGSTLVLLLLYRDCCGMLTIGDSHIYQLRMNRKAIEQISTDDVWENDPVRTQDLTKEQIDQDPRKGKLLHAFGIEEKVEMHRTTARLKGDRIYLLCSDGIYKYAPDGALYDAMQEAEASDDLDDVLQKLKQSVIGNSGKDNYSAIIVKVSGLPEDLEPDDEKAADEDKPEELRQSKKTYVLLMTLFAVLLCVIALAAGILKNRNAQQEVSEVQEAVTAEEEMEAETSAVHMGNDLEQMPEELQPEEEKPEHFQEEMTPEEEESEQKQEELQPEEEEPEQKQEGLQPEEEGPESAELPEVSSAEDLQFADEICYMVTEPLRENRNTYEVSGDNDDDESELMKQMKKTFQSAYDTDVWRLRQRLNKRLEEQILSEAQRGNTESVYYAALLYDEGILLSGDQNRDMAMIYYEKAAAEGDETCKGISFYRMGYMYEMNLVGENDKDDMSRRQAETYYKRALEIYNQIEKSTESAADKN